MTLPEADPTPTAAVATMCPASASQLAADRPPAKRPRLADGVTAASAGGGEWAQVISELQPAIVALKVTNVRSFEEDAASTSLGTGFVVDQARGLILTNRHITGVGPVRATATFDRHEELEVEVLYRDPVHDFGFFRYDPAKLRLTRCAEIELDPAGLKVGAEVRVIGNDAGEKLQILSGTIARVDRNVPEFSTLYNDENTFYAGAGAGTSGGSSGSPVLSKDGRAIALNAAGQEGAASAFFLPLDRVVYAFEKLRVNEAVPRGSCETSFLFKPFDELIRVGLQEKHESDVRSARPETTGMLVADGVLCEQAQLRSGDILLRLQDEVCPTFVQLEAVLDANVGGTVRMLVCRGGEELAFEVPIRDLHALIPRSFVELGLDTLHAIGYHAARRAHLPLDAGVYIARVGYVFASLGCGRAAIVTAVGDKPTPTAEAFVEAVAHVAHRQYFQVSWYELADFRRDRTLKTGFAKMSREWFPLRLWHCHVSAAGQPERWVPKDLPVPAQPPPQELALPPAGSFGAGGDPLVRRLQPSLVTIRFRTDRCFCTEASYSGFSEGAGVLVDAELGLVLTDRHSAPQSLGDVEVTLAGAATVDAEVIFVHPLHNLALLRCDPVAYKQLKKAKVPFAAAKLAAGAKANLRSGDDVHFVGYDNQGNTFSTQVSIAAVYLPSGKDEFPLWDVPRFREHSLEIVVLADTPEDARGGVLCDANGTIRALFAQFDMQDNQREEENQAYGIAANIVGPLVEAIRQQPDGKLKVPSLDAEITAVDVAMLARGAQGKLPKAWLKAVGQRCAQQGQIARAMKVSRIVPTGASEGKLQAGDVLLSIAGQFITCCHDVETALNNLCTGAPTSARRGRAATVKARPAARLRSRSRPNDAPQEPEEPAEGCPEALISVFRNGAEVSVSLRPSLLGTQDEDRLLLWAGLVMRATPRSMLERCGPSVTKALAKAHTDGGVFIQHVRGGSPADTRDLHGHCFIMELDGKPVRGLQDILTIMKESTTEKDYSTSPEGTRWGRRWVRLRLMDQHGQEHVRALQSDPLFFPTLELLRSPEGRWQCVRHDE